MLYGFSYGMASASVRRSGLDATIVIYNLHRATPINSLLLQGFYSCSMPGNIILQSRAADLQLVRSHFYLCKPRYCVSKLTGSHTHRSIEISICYHEYILLGTCNTLLTQFLNVLSMFHSLPIQVTSGSDPDCYPSQRVIQVSALEFRSITRRKEPMQFFFFSKQ